MIPPKGGKNILEIEQFFYRSVVRIREVFVEKSLGESLSVSLSLKIKRGKEARMSRYIWTSG